MVATLQFTIAVAILGLTLGSGAPADCPCSLVDSTAYPGTQKWDCQELSLVSVPGNCWDIANNVTEVVLTGNLIQNVMNIDFAGLLDLRALYVDTNKITFFDVSALDGARKLEKFHGEHNPSMTFPPMTLRLKANLQEVVLTGSAIGSLPLMIDTPVLNRYDVRSAELTSTPRPLFASTITSSTFLLNLMGNQIIEIAADVLLPIPAGGIINLDSFTTIWAADQFQYYDVLNKNWVININLDTNLRVCFQDGSPTDASMCA